MIETLKNYIKLWGDKKKGSVEQNIKKYLVSLLIENYDYSSVREKCCKYKHFLFMIIFFYLGIKFSLEECKSKTNLALIRILRIKTILLKFKNQNGN